MATNEPEEFVTYDGYSVPKHQPYKLTANRHGAGFWDRCNCGIDQSDAPAQRLTDMAHPHGPIELYRGDDGALTLN